MARICFTVFFAISWVIFGSSEQLFAQPQDPPLFEVLVPQDGIFPVHDDFLQPVALRLLGDKKLYAQKVSYLVHFDGQTKEVSDALFRTVEQRGESFVEIPELSLAHFGKIGKTLELSLTVRVLFDDQESGACLTQTSETYLVYDGTAPSYEVLSEDAERLVLKIEDDTSLGEKALSLFEVNEQGGWTKTTTKTLCERVDDTEILCEVQKPQRSHEQSLFVAIIQDKYANTTQVNIFKAPHFEEKLQARVTQRRELMRKRRELQREAAATTFPPPSNQISQCAAQNFALHVFHQEPAGAPTDYPDYPGARDQFLLDSFDQAVALSATAFEAHGLPGLTPHLVQDGIERIELEGEVGETPDQLLVPELDMVIFPVVFEHQSGTTGNIPYHYMLEDSTACRALFRMKESWGTQGVFDVFFIENIEGSEVGFTCRTIGAALIEFNPVVFYHPDGRWGESSFANDEYEKVGSTLLHEYLHALGLGHSDDPQSIMYAFNEDDIEQNELEAGQAVSAITHSTCIEGLALEAAGEYGRASDRQVFGGQDGAHPSVGYRGAQLASEYLNGDDFLVWMAGYGYEVERRSDYCPLVVNTPAGKHVEALRWRYFAPAEDESTYWEFLQAQYGSNAKPFFLGMEGYEIQGHDLYNKCFRVETEAGPNGEPRYLLYTEGWADGNGGTGPGGGAPLEISEEEVPDEYGIIKRVTCEALGIENPCAFDSDCGDGERCNNCVCEPNECVYESCETDADCPFDLTDVCFNGCCMQESDVQGFGGEVVSIGFQS